MTLHDVYICDGIRTPIGRYGGALSGIRTDDLGALPDVSMADALTRLPGISAVRTGGQAAEINIRGMSGGFVFSTLNGREQVRSRLISGTKHLSHDHQPAAHFCDPGPL